MLVIFQSPYCFAIGCPGVLSLGEWTPHVRTRFHESDPTLGLAGFPLQGYHLLGPRFPSRSSFRRLIRVRSPLLTESLLLSFPVPTEMFHFGTFALAPYAFRYKYPCGWVSPFRDPKIAAWLPAPLGLSQVPTSFIASGHQDIHHVPLFAWPHQPHAVPAGSTSGTCVPSINPSFTTRVGAPRTKFRFFAALRTRIGVDCLCIRRPPRSARSDRPCRNPFELRQERRTGRRRTSADNNFTYGIRLSLSDLPICGIYPLVSVGRPFRAVRLVLPPFREAGGRIGRLWRQSSV